MASMGPNNFTNNIHGAIMTLWQNITITQLMGTGCALAIALGFARTLFYIWFHPLARFPGPKLYAAIHFPYLYKNFVKGSWTRDLPALHRQYGPIVRIGPSHLSVDGAIAWPAVYAHRPGVKQEYSKLPVVFKSDINSLMNCPKETHRRQRRHLSHAFSDSALIQQEAIIMKYVDKLLSRLDEIALRNEATNIVEWLNFTTFDIIGDLAFSESFQSLEHGKHNPWVLSIFENIRDISARRFLQCYPFWQLLQSIFNIGPVSSVMAASTHEVRSHAKDKALTRMKFGEYRVDGQRDFVSYMLRKTPSNEVSMSEIEILSTSRTITIAGSETTATALAGFWFYLGRYPRVYKALTEEIRTSFKTEQDITMRSIAGLEYLSACLNEILRVYPPAAETSSRISPGDTIDGIFVPEGTRVTVSQWATFRNPDHFTEPNSFVPERWLPDTDYRYQKKFKGDNHAVFKPFSFGSRDCIGKNLAVKEMQIIIARFLFRFDYQLNDGQDDWHDCQKIFLIWEKGPLYIRLKQRNPA